MQCGGGEFILITQLSLWAVSRTFFYLQLRILNNDFNLIFTPFLISEVIIYSGWKFEIVQKVAKRIEVLLLLIPWSRLLLIFWETIFPVPFGRQPLHHRPQVLCLTPSCPQGLSQLLRMSRIRERGWRERKSPRENKKQERLFIESSSVPGTNVSMLITLFSFHHATFTQTLVLFYSKVK